MYGVKRTTVFLPEDLKAELKSVAASEGCSEAELIRAGIKHIVEERRPRPRPNFPFFSSGELDARNVDELLEGDPARGIPAFGED
jgi:hypothetical protein